MHRAQEFSRAVAVQSSPHSSAPSPAEHPPALRLTAAVASSDPVATSTLRAMLGQTGLVKEAAEWPSLESLKLRHAQDVPDIVFLDLSSGRGSELSFAQEISKLRPSVHIVACSNKRETNPEFLLQAMRSGIRDFLEKPYDRIELASLLARMAEEFAVEPVKKTAAGRLFVVLGTKGGVGTSTVAVNLAVQFARVPSKRTLLLDFSRPMGDVAALLNLAPAFQLRDAVDNLNRLDATLLSGLLTAHKSGLKVLAGAARLDDWQNASLAAIERIVEIAQREFDFVVMDLGSFYSSEWHNVMRAAEVLLVSEADLPGLAKLHRHLGALANLRVSSSRVRLVINRWHRHDEEALEKIENGMKMPVFARLPNNFKQVNEATVRGVAVAKNGDPLTAGFEQIATRLAGLESPNGAKKSRLVQLFSL
jgi:pilus assembly protein CpaE